MTIKLTINDFPVMDKGRERYALNLKRAFDASLFYLIPNFLRFNIPFINWNYEGKIIEPYIHFDKELFSHV
jgi:hypothetical protein